MSARETDPAAAVPAQAEAQADFQMTDAPPAATDLPTISEPPTAASQQQPPPSQPQPTTEATPAQSPAPATKTSTPLRSELQERGTGGGGTGSRAQSAHPDQSAAMPSQAAAHGAPVRQFLNSRVTPALLEGMKKVGKEQPSDPLRVLGEFLIQKSKEQESKA